MMAFAIFAVSLVNAEDDIRHFLTTMQDGDLGMRDDEEMFDILGSSPVSRIEWSMPRSEPRSITALRFSRHAGDDSSWTSDWIGTRTEANGL